MLVLGSIIGGIGGITGVGISLAAADELDDQLATAQAHADQLNAQRAELEQNLVGTTKKLQDAVLELNQIEAQLPVAQAELAKAQAASETAQREALSVGARLADSEAEYVAVVKALESNSEKQAETHRQIAARVRNVVKRNTISPLGLVVGAQDPSEFTGNLAAATAIARSQTRQLIELQDAAAQGRTAQARLTAITDAISELKAQADASYTKAAASQQQAIKHRADIETLETKQRQAKDDIEAQREIELQQIEDAKADQIAIAELIQSIKADQQERDRRIAEERRREEEERQRLAVERAAQEAAEREARGDPPLDPATLELDLVAGGTSFLDWPTNPVVVTSSFGNRLHPTLGITRLHAGTDFRAYCGVPIYAAQSGIVVSRGWFGTGGNMILLDHGDDGIGNNVMSRYLHLSGYNVNADQWVTQGQVIGYSGMTGGVSTGCHLHFEVYVNGAVVDPLTKLP